MVTLFWKQYEVSEEEAIQRDESQVSQAGPGSRFHSAMVNYETYSNPFLCWCMNHKNKAWLLVTIV